MQVGIFAKSVLLVMSAVKNVKKLAFFGRMLKLSFPQDVALKQFLIVSIILVN